MIINVKDLRPNPFRKESVYAEDSDRIDRLKESIKTLEFWDNLICRKEEDGTYTIPYGYHRLIALQELNIEKVDIPVKNIPDDMMVKIMSEENKEWHGNSNVEILYESAMTAKLFIEDHINECGGDYASLETWCKNLFNGETGFSNSVKSHKTLDDSDQRLTIGYSVLLRFLGGTWTKHHLQLALGIDKEEHKTKVKLPVSIPSEKTTDTPKEETPLESSEEVLEETIVKEFKVDFKISKEATLLLKNPNASKAFMDVLLKEPNCRCVFPDEHMQMTLAKKILVEVPKLSYFSVYEYIINLTDYHIEISTKLEGKKAKDYAYLFSTPKNNRSKKLLNELKILQERMEELPDFTSQRVLTMDMVQHALNRCRIIAYTALRYEKKLSEYFSLLPDMWAYRYKIYTELEDIVNPDIPDLLVVDAELKEIDYEEALNEEEQQWIEQWIKESNTSVDETD